MIWNHLAQNKLLSVQNGIILLHIICYVYEMDSFSSK